MKDILSIVLRSLQPWKIKCIFLLSFLFLIYPTLSALGAKPGEVIINEVMWAGGDNEWIELYNNTNQEIDLSGWKIDNTRSASVESNTLLLNGKIEPGSYFVICETAMENCDFNLQALSPTQYKLSLADTYSDNGLLILKDKEENIIDKTPEPAGTQWPAGKKDTTNKTNKKYYSMERVNPAISGSEESNWKTTVTEKTCDLSADGKIYYYGTPRAQNSQFSTEVPEPLSADAGNSIISLTGKEITFDGSGSTGNIKEYFWNFGDGATTKGKIVTHKYNFSGKYIVSLIVSDEKQQKEDIIEVSIFSDVIFISEFSPKDKWIEIVNLSDQIQDISGWQISDKNEKESKFIFPGESYIAPNNFLLLSSSLLDKNSFNSGSLFLSYPSGDIRQEIRYSSLPKDGEWSIARKGEDYFYTKLQTMGMPNIISGEEKDVSLGISEPTSAPKVPKDSQPSNGKIAITDDAYKGDAGLTSEVKGVRMPEPRRKILTEDTLNEVKENKKALALAGFGVSIFSGVYGFSLVKLRRKMKRNKRLSTNNGQQKLGKEVIEVEIEK